MGPAVRGQVHEDLDPGQQFAQAGPEPGQRMDIRRVETDGVDAVVAGDIDGPFVMETLADYDIGCLSEHFPGPDHGVERPESGIVQHDQRIRNAPRQQGAAHHLRLVVGSVAVVAADEDLVHLAGAQQRVRSVDPVAEVEIGAAVAEVGGSAEQQRGVAVRHFGKLLIEKGCGIAADPEVTDDHQRYDKPQQSGDDPQQFLHRSRSSQLQIYEKSGGLPIFAADMKICVGLSGGVDSSVAALLLKQQGYDVFAMFMQNWHDTEGTLHGDCEWEEERFVAEMVARKIGIPFYFIDLSKEYRQRVVDYMFDEYARGRTPNPDVLCNREIKFAAFLEAAERLGADCVATGHYCRKETLPDGTCRILEGTDPGKDQSYFLCQLSQEQLGKALFPIGGLYKSDVRRIAREADLPSAEKKDSQGICFVGKVDLPVFLQQKLKSVEGDVVEVFHPYYADSAKYVRDQELLAKGTALTDSEWLELSTPLDYSDIRFETETYRSGKHHVKKTRDKENPWGKRIGRHEGAQFYTIGQRKGLGIGGHANPVFVLATDIDRNIIYVGEGEDHPGLLRSCLRIAPDEIHWIRPDQVMQPGEERRYRVRIRYRQPLQDATLLMRGSGLFIRFDRPQRSITPGQFAVWYAPDGEMLGSGVISG